MKYHSHERRDEVWTVVSGQGRTIVDGVEREVRPGDVVTIKAGSKHMLIADTDISVIEVQIGVEISQADKVVYPMDVLPAVQPSTHQSYILQCFSKIFKYRKDALANSLSL